MTALVLGSSGFIGRALVRCLEARGDVVMGYSSATLDLRRADALDQLEASGGPSTTLYLVAALTPERGVGLSGLADNLAMVLNVARFVERTPLGACVYFSSDALYPMQAEPVDETTPVEATNLYALAKLNGERMLEHAARANGTRLVSLRVTGAYGPGDPHNGYGPNRFVRAIAEGRPVQLFGDGEEQRDHIFVEDVARVAIALATTSEGGVFNVATGTSRSFASIVADLRSVAPVPFTVEHLPRTGPITHRSFKSSRLISAVPGVRSTPFSDGLSQTLAAALQTWTAVRV